MNWQISRFQIFRCSTVYNLHLHCCCLPHYLFFNIYLYHSFYLSFFFLVFFSFTLVWFFLLIAIRCWRKVISSVIFIIISFIFFILWSSMERRKWKRMREVDVLLFKFDKNVLSFHSTFHLLKIVLVLVRNYIIWINSVIDLNLYCENKK